MQASNLKTGRTDMKTLVQDAQDLFREATSTTGMKAEELRDKGMALLESAIGKAQDVQAAAVETGKEIATSADDYVHDNPWQSVAISAGIGVAIGFALGCLATRR